MSDIKKTKKEFNKKLDELRKDSEPAYQIQSNKEIVIYDKLIEIEEKIEKLSGSIKTKELEKTTLN